MILWTGAVISCGVLPAPQHGRKSTHRFDPGTKVEFYCDAGYILTGEGRRWCYESAEWNWAVWGDARCICKSSCLEIPFKSVLWTFKIDLKRRKLAILPGPLRVRAFSDTLFYRTLPGASNSLFDHD